MDWQSPASIVKVTKSVRSTIETIGRRSVTAHQQETLKEVPVVAPTVVSKWTIPTPPEDDVRQLLSRTIDLLNENNGEYVLPESIPIEARWTGSSKSGPKLSDEEKYEDLVKEVTSPVVVLFIYGGAYYSNSPSTYTKTAAKLSEMTGGKCMTIRQRLAPQHPFPSALLDVLTAYLSLLAPPPGSFHKAVPASSIVLAGDSSGGGLTLALLQTLLTIKRQNWASSFLYHGKPVDIALPAGLTILSPCTDYSDSLPSHVKHAKYDIFENQPPFLQPTFPACEAWPSSPPRGSLYCEGSMMGHPLVSPVTSRDWRDSPPMWIVTGQEQFGDGQKMVAQNAHEQGVNVVFKEYEAMPHCWIFIYSGSFQAIKCWKEWAQVCKDLVEGQELVSEAVFVKARGLAKKPIDWAKLSPLSMNDVLDLLKKAPERYTEKWVGPKSKAG